MLECTKWIKQINNFKWDQAKLKNVLQCAYFLSHTLYMYWIFFLKFTFSHKGQPWGNLHIFIFLHSSWCFMDLTYCFSQWKLIVTIKICEHIKWVCVDVGFSIEACKPTNIAKTCDWARWSYCQICGWEELCYHQNEHGVFGLFINFIWSFYGGVRNALVGIWQLLDAICMI